MLGRRALLLTGLAATLPRLAGAEPARRGGTLRWAVRRLPASLDPMASTFEALPALYDTLSDADSGLVDSWQFTDPQTLVIDLKPRIAFHDGSLCASDSVKANLDRHRFDTVDDILVLGRYRLQLHLSRPDPGLPATLAGPAGLIASPASFHGNPVGTGPFRFVSRTDQRLTLARNESYRLPDLPLLDEIEITAAADPVAAVTAGQADLALGPQGTAQSPRLHDITPNLARAWLG